MLGANRYVGRLVFRQEHGFIPINDLGGTPNNNPMLGTVMVHLQ